MNTIYQEKLIINLLQTNSGGGLQNALSFLKTLIEENKSDLNTYVFLVRKDTLLYKLVLEDNLNHIAIKNNNLSRLVFELNLRKYFSKNQVCFYPFGIAMLRSSNYLINVGGCALSNLFYPNLDFWGYLPFFKKKLKHLRDRFREAQLRKMDYWIFETENLKNRAIKYFGFPQDRTVFIPMAPSAFVTKEKVVNDLKEKYNKIIEDRFAFLFLSGPHPNKRLHLISNIVSEMKKQKCDDFVIITTLDMSKSYAKDVYQGVKENSDYFINIGPIHQTEVSSLLSSVSAVCNISLLESFSNNYIEAWKMELPLVVTDADWSRDICKDTAIYIDPQNPKSSAEMMVQLIRDNNLRKGLIANCHKILKTYNTPSSKNKQYFIAIDQAKLKGNLSKKERESIFQR